MQDIVAERALLAGIIRYGASAYYDVADIVNENSFTVDSNAILYKICKTVLERDDKTKIDIPTVYSTAKELNLTEIYQDKTESQHLQAVINFPVELSNVRKFGAKVAKLAVARLLTNQLSSAQDRLSEVDGNESYAHILGIAEDAIFNFSTLLNDNDGPVLLGKDLKEKLKHREDNPVEQIGISTGYKRFDQAIGGGLRKGTVNIIGARIKCLRYGSSVYTKNGSKKIEDVLVGEEILHPFGGTSKILSCNDHYLPIYRVHFRDGDYIDCCGDHIWHVYKRYPYNDGNKKEVLKTTLELKNDLKIGNRQEYKWDVMLCSPVEFNNQDITIDPYVLGLLLGDGSLGNSVTVASHIDDSNELLENLKNRITNEIKVDNKHGNCITYRINGIQPELRKLDLLHKDAYNKFIPKNYIYNTVQVRLEVLRGLMDTDGTVGFDKRSKNAASRSKFNTVSRQLAEDVKEIVQSLGGLCSIRRQHQIYDNKNYWSFHCEVRLPRYNLFRLTRKAKKYSERVLGKLKRTIVNIEEYGIYDNVRCLTIDRSDGLFLTSNYVVTHNTGKSLLGDNIGSHISANIGIPVFNLDTEMLAEDHQNRTTAMLSEVSIDEIETGKFGKNESKRQRVYEAVSKIEKMNYYHQCIGGMPFEEQLAVMRRWLVKEVGLNPDNTAKPCVFIYDYVKLMSEDSITKNIQEYQALGFVMTGLHNFALRYKVPILGFVQLNRDGITKESSDVSSGSDRILWLCSNFTIYKPKSDEEIAQDGPQHGTRKLVPVVARHGKGLDSGDYINMQFKGEFGKITEGKTRNEIAHTKKKNDSTDSFQIMDSEPPINDNYDNTNNKESVCPFDT